MNNRNLAIIAHVDHGKTTLIDGLFRQAGVFADHQHVEDRVMDRGELEKERGITIQAKNAAFEWKNTRINIIDTPGHADFGGEVERALFMVDGALLLVDAAEGPLPQTRFVLRKALDRKLKLIVVINKVDRPDARIEEIEEKILELFYDVAHNDDQVDYTTFYASAKNGWANTTPEASPDFTALLDAIIEQIPSPRVESADGPFKMLVANRSYNSYVGQLAVGRIESGTVKEGMRIRRLGEDKATNFAITALETYDGLGTRRVPELTSGDIALVAGLDHVLIGDTLCSEDVNEALPRLKVDPPNVGIRVSVNTSPFAGQDGEYLTSRKLEEMLRRACLANVAISLQNTDAPEVFLLKARGELQIVVLLEELRRQGFELMAGRPEILPTEKDGEQWEPEETLVVDVPESAMGTVTEMVSKRGGKMQMIEHMELSARVRLEFDIPSRGLIGIRSQMLTETRGEAIYASSFKRFIPYQGKRFSRINGAIVCDRKGATTEYALHALESRGILFIPEGIKVYEGMVFGENNRSNDMNANPTKEKKLTNMRASGTDESTKLAPVKPMTLDQALEWIDEDEWVEITPKNVRIRKDELQTNLRSLIRR